MTSYTFIFMCLVLVLISVTYVESRNYTVEEKIRNDPDLSEVSIRF